MAKSIMAKSILVLVLGMGYAFAQNSTPPQIIQLSGSLVKSGVQGSPAKQAIPAAQASLEELENVQVTHVEAQLIRETEISATNRARNVQLDSNVPPGINVIEVHGALRKNDGSPPPVRIAVPE